MSQANVSPITFADDVLTQLADTGEKFARTDTDRAFALHQFMRLVGAEPTYAQWEAARVAAIVGYRRTKPAANDDACNTWWSRLLAALRQYANEGGFAFTIPAKPKADTPEAQKKAAARANPYADKPRAEVEAALDALKAAPETMETAKAKVKALDALDKLAKAETKALEKAQADALKPRRDAVRKVIAGAPAHVLALMEAIVDLTADGASDKAKARAWAVIQATAPKSTLPTPAKARKVA